MLRRLPRHVGAGRAARSRPAPAATLTTAPGPTSPGAGGLDPYEYTSGHWLRDDAAQRRARRVDFSFDALCQAAVRSCPGAKGIVRCDKVEGNFNRAFILGLDNGASVVARVPFSVAGPARLVTNSEVATLAYSTFPGVPTRRAVPDRAQYEGRPPSPSQRCWTGATTRPTRRAPSTSSWSTRRACSSRPPGPR